MLNDIKWRDVGYINYQQLDEVRFYSDFYI